MARNVCRHLTLGLSHERIIEASAEPRAIQSSCRSFSVGSSTRRAKAGGRCARSANVELG